MKPYRKGTRVVDAYTQSEARVVSHEIFKNEDGALVYTIEFQDGRRAWRYTSELQKVEKNK